MEPLDIRVDVCFYKNRNVLDYRRKCRAYSEMEGQESEGSATTPSRNRFSLSKSIHKLSDKLRSRSSSSHDRINPSATQLSRKPPTTIKKDENEAVPHGEPLKSAIAQDTIGITDNGQPQADNKSQGANLAVESRSPFPITSHETLLEMGLIKTTTEPSREVLNLATLVISPIRELWNQAYDDLRTREENLVKEYDATLSRNLNTVIGSTVATVGLKVGREDQMKIILKAKVEEVNQNIWKLKFGANEVPVKDLMQPVVGTIDWANEYINAAVSANPYASIAWVGVGLLLPVSDTFPNSFIFR